MTTMIDCSLLAADSAVYGIVAQIRIAWRNPLPALIGALLGALVPSATFTVGHYELTSWIEPRALIVLGGLVFSALTVFRWGRLAFCSPVKALGFVVLAEGVMTFSATAWLSMVALGYLVVINAIATGCTIALGAAEDPQATAPPAGADVSVPVTAALTSLDSRLTALEAPRAPQGVPSTAKRVRRRPAKKRISRQLAMAPVMPALPAEDLRGAACA